MNTTAASTSAKSRSCLISSIVYILFNYSSNGAENMSIYDHNIIDIDEEKERLSKSLNKLQKEISALKGRLQNSSFVKSAPQEVILETQENLKLREEEERTLSAAASQL